MVLQGNVKNQKKMKNNFQKRKSAIILENIKKRKNKELLIDYWMVYLNRPLSKNLRIKSTKELAKLFSYFRSTGHKIERRIIYLKKNGTSSKHIFYKYLGT